MANSLLFAILITHWIGDFVCQSHWVATNKSKNSVALSLHVVIYTLVLGSGMLIFMLINDLEPTIWLCWFMAINGIIHFITDFITSRWTAYLWRCNDYHNFFVVIGLDQLLHYTCIILTISLINYR